ncbi:MULTISPECIES: fluoride efflux transporter CrcB [unclassified Sphingobium]|uniref:fluoride efflux transporter CrcB n=1 Tax=unclassified Sphingobium TaxID=2611147 RepID=UPI0022257A7B|nr:MULTISPECIES: fluoride efflux transporter CrcB [unclassified Sphingobium]MCW2396369.1 CrcB protein [Sphingobium sp. B8D3B]MCW2419885.1 CrcB protein [Sphingobium sp. B8D3C]
MLNTVLVMIGGAIGAALRYQLGRASLGIMGPGYPWGTLAANVLGGLAMGLVAGWLAARYQGQQGEQIRLLVAVGVLGGFTTFSAFSLETMLMIERGEALNALGYVLLSVAASIGALALGLTLMRSATA